MTYVKYIIVLLLASSISAKTPIDYNKWQLDSNKYAISFGTIDNYPDTDTTFAEIDNTLLSDNDTAFYNNTSVLKTRISDNGRVSVKVKWDSVTYEVWQRPIKLIWLNTQTKNWTDVISGLSWPEPTKDSLSVTWNFPGFDYSVIKDNGIIDYRIIFKDAFLDSAVMLYNQRTDSQYIALGNVHAYSFVNVNDSTLIDIAEVNMKRLKTIGKYHFDISRQYLQWNGSDPSTAIPVKQRWVKVNNKIYCIEFVMMSDVKKVHEDYPASNIWHGTIVTLDDTECEDAMIKNSYGSNQNWNYGAYLSLTCKPYPAGASSEAYGIYYFDMSGIPSNSTVDTAHFMVHSYYSLSHTYDLSRITVDWNAGNVNGGVIDATDEEGCTWDNANEIHNTTDTTYWTGASQTDFSNSLLDNNSGSYYASATSDAVDNTYDIYLTGSTFFALVEDLIDGTYSNYGWLMSCADEGTLRSEESATVPNLYIEYTEGGAPAPIYKRRRKIIIGEIYNEENNVLHSRFAMPYVRK